MSCVLGRCRFLLLEMHTIIGLVVLKVGEVDCAGRFLALDFCLRGWRYKCDHIKIWRILHLGIKNMLVLLNLNVARSRRGNNFKIMLSPLSCKS